MKVGEVSQVTAHYLELKKTDERIRLEQEKLKQLQKHKEDLARTNPIDPLKGQHIDVRV